MHDAVKNISLFILVAEKESSFRKLLLKVLHKEELRFPEIHFFIDRVGNPKELKSYKKAQTDLAFINLSFMEGKFTTFKNLTGFNKKTILILLISDEGGEHIRKAVKAFRKQRHYFFDEHILTDNYNGNILLLFCRDLIKRVVTNKMKH